MFFLSVSVLPFVDLRMGLCQVQNHLSHSVGPSFWIKSIMLFFQPWLWIWEAPSTIPGPSSCWDLSPPSSRGGGIFGWKHKDCCGLSDRWTQVDRTADLSAVYRRLNPWWGPVARPLQEQWSCGDPDGPAMSCPTKEGLKQKSQNLGRDLRRDLWLRSRWHSMACQWPSAHQDTSYELMDADSNASSFAASLIFQGVLADWAQEGHKRGPPA